MATLSFCDFEDALEVLQSATTNATIRDVVEQIDQQFNAGTLDVSPEQWGRLASAVLSHKVEITPSTNVAI